MFGAKVINLRMSHDDSLTNPGFQLAVDRMEKAGIIQRFRDGNGQRFIALTPMARQLPLEELIKEMLDS
jgi:DNA-binding MarR family transcriptional regulator